jgi:predicted regulator of Ras-like GTPase activity (Roadblock/LC7/MglB family)
VSAATPAQVRQWSDEVAADPASLSFLPLAGAYREQGRRDAALKLCIRGLEKHPDNVEAHYLLGLLYREGGDTLKAFDEWDIALALDPEHAGSRREIGLVAHARGDHAVAVRHLERALETDAFDQEVRTALEDAWAQSRGGGGRSSAPRSAPAAAPAATAADVPASAPAPPPAPAAVPLPVAAAAGAAETHFDAAMGEFAALSAERGIVGAVLLDDQGFVLAGQMTVAGVDRAPEIAAVLSGASSEAGRALGHLGLGAWKGILVETPDAVVRLAPAGDGMIAVAGRREVPTGWTLRVAARARDAALRFLGAGGDA